MNNNLKTDYEYNPTRAVFEMPLGICIVERRYTTQLHNNEPAYKQDEAYFKARKDRWIAIRKAFLGEVDSVEATVWVDGSMIVPPTAWMRVTRHPTLGFTSVIVWRGQLQNVNIDSQGYVSLESDEAIELILDSMRKHGCANWIEVNSYIEKLERAKAIYNAQKSTAATNPLQ